MPSDPVLTAAAAAFAFADVLGSAVAMRHDVAGEPFGLAIPLTVRSGLLIGLGAGVAAPWPMPVAALIGAARAGRLRRGDASGFMAVGLGLGCIAGTLIEPVTYHRRGWTPAIRTAVGVNVVASAALAAAGLRHVRSR